MKTIKYKGQVYQRVDALDDDAYMQIGRFKRLSQNIEKAVQEFNRTYAGWGNSFAPHVAGGINECLEALQKESKALTHELSALL